ncbi:amidohydrolase family protein [Streptomyces sp. NPDC055955]|uniref:amidohydrolase family protein n=1 Tax=Streptomyces sp. NPDC055955 TaxID=3345665 RepID=UPI0035D83DEB
MQSAADLIRSATTTTTRFLREEGRIGTLAVGAHADLLVLDGNPLEDISVLTKPREHLRHVIKGGHAHVSYASTHGTLRPMPREHCVALRHRLRDVPVRGDKEGTETRKARRSSHSLPLLTYSALGGLRQGPHHPSQSLAEARTCGNGRSTKCMCCCRLAGRVAASSRWWDSRRRCGRSVPGCACAHRRTSQT